MSSALALLSLIEALRDARRKLRAAERNDLLSTGRGGIEAATTSAEAVKTAQRVLANAESGLADFCVLHGPPSPCARKLAESVDEVAAAWGALKGFESGVIAAPEARRPSILKVHQSRLDQAIEVLIEWSRDQVVTTQPGQFVRSAT